MHFKGWYYYHRQTWTKSPEWWRTSRLFFFCRRIEYGHCRERQLVIRRLRVWRFFHICNSGWRSGLTKSKTERKTIYYEQFKERIEEDLHQALADHGIDANLSQHHVEKLNASYDAISVTPEGSHIGVNANLSAMFEAIENGQDYNEVVSRASELM